MVFLAGAWCPSWFKVCGSNPGDEKVEEPVAVLAPVVVVFA
jgi:hypothetical protein